MITTEKNLYDLEAPTTSVAWAIDLQRSTLDSYFGTVSNPHLANVSSLLALTIQSAMGGRLSETIKKDQFKLRIRESWVEKDVSGTLSDLIYHCHPINI